MRDLPMPAGTICLAVLFMLHMPIHVNVKEIIAHFSAFY
jgi:hypothetical protein